MALASAIAITTIAGCPQRDLLPIRNHEFPVDARIVADGLCWLRCFKLQECGVAAGSDPTCRDTCTQATIDALDDDPCWVETVEVRRCVARKMSCDAIVADEIPSGDTTPCERWIARHDSCSF